MGYNMGSLLLHFRHLDKSLKPRKNFIEKKIKFKLTEAPLITNRPNLRF